MDLTPSVQALPPGCPWSIFHPPTIQYCERNLCSIITQPANTLSNLAYFIAGYYLNKQNKRNGIYYLRYFPIIVILTGIASLLYHASFTFFFQFFDLSAMYLFSSMIIVLNMRRAEVVSESVQTPVFVGMVGVSMLFLLFFNSIGLLIFLLHVFVAFFSEIYLFRLQIDNISYHYYALTLLFFGIALVAWFVDYARIFCFPNNHFLQGHAIWHILSSFCFVFIYKFYAQKMNFDKSYDGLNLAPTKRLNRI